MAKSTKSTAKKTKPAAAKAPAKKPAAKVVAPAKSSPAKPAAKAPAPKAAPAPAPKAAPVAAKVASSSSKAPMSAADLKRKILERKAAPKAIAFSLDEVREIAQKNEKTVESNAKNGKTGAKPAANGKAVHADPTKLEKPAKPNHIRPASLADILGTNAGKNRSNLIIDESQVPDKFKRYYKILVELRKHVLEQLGEHTEETLLKSSKDDSGDLSGYGQHMADAGTDTFDRDFALSLVSSEQEALAEIEAAIKRIHDGSYGICESTQQPISKERLLAVPFTRYSAEAKKIVERHSHREQQRGGLFGEAGEEDGGKMSDDGGGGDD